VDLARPWPNRRDLLSLGYVFAQLPFPLERICPQRCACSLGDGGSGRFGQVASPMLPRKSSTMLATPWSKGPVVATIQTPSFNGCSGRDQLAARHSKCRFSTTLALSWRTSTVACGQPTYCTPGNLCLFAIPGERGASIREQPRQTFITTRAADVIWQPLEREPRRCGSPSWPFWLRWPPAAAVDRQARIRGGQRPTPRVAIRCRGRRRVIEPLRKTCQPLAWSRRPASRRRTPQLL
jgi:hypothetical protein